MCDSRLICHATLSPDQKECVLCTLECSVDFGLALTQTLHIKIRNFVAFQRAVCLVL